jgi:hypothetical protein
MSQETRAALIRCIRKNTPDHAVSIRIAASTSSLPLRRDHLRKRNVKPASVSEHNTVPKIRHGVF